MKGWGRAGRIVVVIRQAVQYKRCAQLVDNARFAVIFGDGRRGNKRQPHLSMKGWACGGAARPGQAGSPGQARPGALNELDMHLGKLLGAALIGVPFALSGCASLDQGARPGSEFEALMQSAAERPEVRLNSAVLAGELAASRNMHLEAARHYAEASSLSEDPRIAARATQFALQAESGELALRASRRWAELDPTQLSAYEISARLSLREADYPQVVRFLRNLLALSPDTGQALIGVAEVLASEPLELERALQLYSEITAGQQAGADLEYGRALVAYRFGGSLQAQQALVEALRLKPGWRQAQMLALRLHLQSGELEPAGDLIRDLHVAAPRDLDLRLALGALLLEHEQLALARKEFSKALKIDAGNIGALYALGLIAMDGEDLDAAERHFQKLYEQGERRSDAAYYLGRVAEQRGALKQAMDYYRNVRDGRRLVDAAVRQAVVLSRQGQTEAARSYLEALRSRFPEQELRLFQVEGELLYQARDDAAAEAVYTHALQRFDKDADLLYGRAIVRERLGRVPAAEADLQQILKDQPDDARALNALGYMLSNHTQRLDEAGRYIRRALEITPDDPAVIDSMGWLYFRQGRLEEARTYLEQAYARFKDPEVAAHLGEVLWLQGERERARKVWNLALEKDPDHPVLQETIRRLDSAI